MVDDSDADVSTLQKQIQVLENQMDGSFMQNISENVNQASEQQISLHNKTAPLSSSENASLTILNSIYLKKKSISMEAWKDNIIRLGGYLNQVFKIHGKYFIYKKHKHKHSMCANEYFHKKKTKKKNN